MTLDEFKEFAQDRGFKLKPANPPKCSADFSNSKFTDYPCLQLGNHRYVIFEYKDIQRIYYEKKERPTAENRGGWVKYGFADVASLWIEDRRIKGLGKYFDHPLNPPLGELEGDPIQINTF
jgi:hypothetical protein